MNPAKGRRVNAVRLSRELAFPASLFPLPRYFRLHDQSIRCRAHVTNRPARGKHERRRRPRIERRVVCAHDTDSGHRPHDRSARALRDHGIAHCDAAEGVKVPVAMRGDHARPAVAREYASDHVSRSGSELVVAHAGGFGIPEMGVRRTGMAAIVGRPDEPAAVFQNPAGLTMLHGTRVYASFGLAFVSTEFRLRPWQDSDRFIDDPVDADGYYPAQKPTRAMGAIPMIVATSPLWRDKLYGAFSLYVSNATGAQFRRDGRKREAIRENRSVQRDSQPVQACRG